MVAIDIVYEGELHCCAKHGPSGVEFTTDAPVDNHGRGESFSPTDLVGTAMGTCMATIMGIAAQKHGIDMQGTRVHVEKAMVADPVRRIGKLTIEIAVPGVHDEKARALLEAAAHGCPVKASLAPAVEVAVSFRWGT